MYISDMQTPKNCQSMNYFWNYDDIHRFRRIPNKVCKFLPIHFKLGIRIILLPIRFGIDNQLCMSYDLRVIASQT